MSGSYQFQPPQMLAIQNNQLPPQANPPILNFSLAPISNLDKTITPEHWEARKAHIQPSRPLINELIMNYLVVEGYKEGALKFQKEAGIKAEMDHELIDARIEVRRMIESGEVEEAIKKVNRINPEILETNPELYFELKRQQLVELIKAGKLEDAIVFAQTNLSNQIASGGSENPLAQKFHAEVDKTMTLLMYDDLSASPMHDLVDISSRQRLAGKVNQAILKAQGYSSELKLAFYWQLLQYSQGQLSNIEFPKITDPMELIGVDKKEDDGSKDESGSKQKQVTFNI